MSISIHCILQQCLNSLFVCRSDDKFKCGCGWPAFSRAAGANESGDDSGTNIERLPDNSHGMERTEVVCKNVCTSVCYQLTL